MKQAENKELICITCPMGCSLRVTLNNGEFCEVSGNRCKRGAEYAYAEITHPVRVLTTTVAIKEHPERVLPVKSDRPIPKEKLFEAMRFINAASVSLPIAIGDIILPDLFGANIVATRSMK